MSDDRMSLPEAVCVEMTRVRDEVLAQYIDAAAVVRATKGSAADLTPSISVMRRDLDQAASALARQDTTELLRLLAVLRSWE